jgi:hypothetical protein
MMVMTETNFSEFITFINTHPKWRHKLVKALFPGLNVAKAFQDLAESQRQMQQTLQELSKRVGHVERDLAVLTDRVEQGFAEAASERARIENKVDKGFAEAASERARIENKVDKGFAEAATERAGMKHDIANIKGINYEGRVAQYADAIFGLFIRRGHNARNEVGLLLEEAEDNGLISEQEHEHVYALDLLWAGKQKETKADIVLAIEVSWRAEETDIERAVTRANVLRKAGLIALPVVAGVEWDEAITSLAHQHKVVIVTEKKVDKLSWHNANNLSSG